MDKTPRTAETTAPPAKPAAARSAATVRRTSRLQTLALAGAVALMIAVLAFLRPSDTDTATDNVSGRAESAVDGSSSQPAPAQPPMAASAPEAKTSIVKARSKKTPAAKLDKDRTARSAALPAHPVAPMKSTADASAQADAATMPVASESRAAADAPVSSSSETVGGVPVTISGCLEVSVDHNEFRLTDTEGADAPKARSWRSGFLKKRSAPVALIEPPDPRGLQKQVGKRVAATGLLTSNEMKVSSLHVVGASCN